jgi:hypothetical protein
MKTTEWAKFLEYLRLTAPCTVRIVPEDSIRRMYFTLYGEGYKNNTPIYGMIHLRKKEPTIIYLAKHLENECLGLALYTYFHEKTHYLTRRLIWAVDNWRIGNLLCEYIADLGARLYMRRIISART